MLKKLISNIENYYWRFNSDGDLILGYANLEPKAKVIFNITSNWVNIAPIVETYPGIYIGKPETHIKGSEKFNLVIKLHKIVSEYLAKEPKVDYNKIYSNTSNLLQEYYNKKRE